MLVFEKNIMTRFFFRIKVLMQEGSPKKCVFHRTPLSRRAENDEKLTFSGQMS